MSSAGLVSDVLTKTGGKNYLADPRLHVTIQNRPATDEDPGPED
ncbi:MAG TPA: hypothetical protein VGP89_05480 [Candidatus Angelobacter sp.]|jgi:hypothetical protein|nr:hypothetical protein [Candidatus Angelobacter sp.]